MLVLKSSATKLICFISCCFIILSYGDKNGRNVAKTQSIPCCGNSVGPTTTATDSSGGERGQSGSDQSKGDQEQSCPKGDTSCGSEDEENNFEKSKYSIEKNKRSSPDDNDDDDYNKLIQIKGGAYIIGTDDPFFPQDGEGPAREIVVGDFKIQQYEVTNREFSQFVESTGYRTEVEIKSVMHKLSTAECIYSKLPPLKNNSIRNSGFPFSFL